MMHPGTQITPLRLVLKLIISQVITLLIKLVHLHLENKQVKTLLSY